MTFASVTTGGTLTASANAGDHSSIGSSSLNASKSVNLNWTLTPAGLGFTSYSATFNFNNPGDLDAGADPTRFVVGKFNSPTWAYPNIGTTISTSTQATGMTSFSDFEVAESMNTPPVANSGVAAGQPGSDGLSESRSAEPARPQPPDAVELAVDGHMTLATGDSRPSKSNWTVTSTGVSRRFWTNPG